MTRGQHHPAKYRVFINRRDRQQMVQTDLLAMAFGIEFKKLLSGGRGSRGYRVRRQLLAIDQLDI